MALAVALTLTAALDPGPGKRSGEGSLTVLPYLMKSLADKIQPDDAAQDKD
jgi:hypothetical protein